MHFSYSNLRLSSPISSENKICKDTNPIDQEFLYHRLHAVLLTLMAEKEEFEEKFLSEKKDLQMKIKQQDERIIELQTKNEKSDQQCRTLRFNFHQRGSVVDYLKKKITAIQKKFDSEKEQMVSVIKYLQSRNFQLNQIIFQLKKKELDLNQNVFNLQQKYFNLSNELSIRNISQNQFLRVNHKKVIPQRKSMCHIKSGSMTPQYASHKYKSKVQNNLFSSRQNNMSNLKTMEDSNNESIEQSSIREKTVRYDGINRVKSDDQFDFLVNDNRISSRDTKTNKLTDMHQISGKRILINNYGHLSFTDYAGECRPSGIKKQNLVSKPKVSLPSNARFSLLTTQRVVRQN